MEHYETILNQFYALFSAGDFNALTAWASAILFDENQLRENRAVAGAHCLYAQMINEQFKEAKSTGDKTIQHRAYFPSPVMELQFLMMFQYSCLKVATDGRDLAAFVRATEIGEQIQKLRARGNLKDTEGFRWEVAPLFAEILEMTNKLVGELGWSPSEKLMQTEPDYGLMRAAVNGHLAQVKFFIKRGANINVQNESCTPLLFAISEDHFPVATYLLDQGAGFADKAARDTAVEIARRNGCFGLIDRLQIAPVLSSEGCFIATVCFGSYDALEVKVLRKFRDDKLIPTPWGLWVVNRYYKYSPQIARLIAHKPTLKKSVRVFLLAPIIWVIGRCFRIK
ncbi:MAG: ankyrin repeat domain-containing protein [Bacteroidota bacterium]